MDRNGYRDWDREIKDRESQKKEDRKGRQSLFYAKVDGEPVDSSDVRFGGLNPDDAEYESVETFADYLRDNDQDSFTHCELMCLNARTGIVSETIKITLAVYGFKLQRRDFAKPVRGFTANPNAGRFDGMCGGGGGSSTNGFAGYAG